MDNAQFVQFVYDIVKEQAKSIKVLNDHSALVDSQIAEIATNVGWLMKSYWVVAAASVGGLISSVLQHFRK